MSKVEILRLDSVTTNDTRATALINTNFHNIQTVIDTLLSRTNETPNYMDTVLDMNSQRIINTAMPTEDFDVVNLKYLRDYSGNVESLVADATAAAEAALEKANNAAASATSSASYAQTAQAAAAQAAQDAIDAAAASHDISTMLSDPNLVAVGTDLRLGDSSLIKQVSEIDVSAVLQAASDAHDDAQDAARYAQTAEDAKELAVAAADTITGMDFAVDLQYANNYLQLIDQHGDALGTAVEITGGGGSGSGTVFIATNIAVSELDFEEDETYEEYPYKVEKTVAGVTNDMTCMATLPLDIAELGAFAPIVLVGNGTVTLWSKEIIEDNFTIPSITFFASGEE